MRNKIKRKLANVVCESERRLAGFSAQWACEGPYSGVYAAPAAVFRLTFLGSVEVEEDSRRRKRRPKKNMVEEAVTKIKVVWLPVLFLKRE